MNSNIGKYNHYQIWLFFIIGVLKKNNIYQEFISLNKNYLLSLISKKKQIDCALMKNSTDVCKLYQLCNSKRNNFESQEDIYKYLKIIVDIIF
jgi:hypothetical protein